MNHPTDELQLRELASMLELRQSEILQTDVWGEDDPADNADLLMAIQHAGGLVAGAFLKDRLVGFLFAFPTANPDVQHSHRLAVHPSVQGQGIGVKLKWFQRQWCLHRGINTVNWTYDPIRHINAALNITRLRATSCCYHEDYYGEMRGINAGNPSDRIVVDWRLDSAAVVQAAENPGIRSQVNTNETQGVEIPSEFAKLLREDPDQALRERLRVRKALTSAFTQGYRIVDFDPKTSQYWLTSRQSR